MASISIAANLLSNTNSNSNNNNNNNNDNNKNDNNINIGSSNNNVNNQNVLMFNPMMGRRSVLQGQPGYASIFWHKKEAICNAQAGDQVPVWMKKAVFNALDFFLRLKSCSKTNQDKCQYAQVEQEKINLDLIKDETEQFVIEHLMIGTAKIAGFGF
jgi:hypothetical protein